MGVMHYGRTLSKKHMGLVFRPVSMVYYSVFSIVLLYNIVYTHPAPGLMHNMWTVYHYWATQWSQQKLFTLNLTQLHTSLGSWKSSMNFLFSHHITISHHHLESFTLGAKCNWARKCAARLGIKLRTLCAYGKCSLDWATELLIHSLTISYVPTLDTSLTQIKCGKVLYLVK